MIHGCICLFGGHNNMKQDFIGEKNIRDIEKISGFGKKEYYVHTSSSGSVIQLDLHEIEQYQQKKSAAKTVPHNDVGYHVLPRQEQPINLTKEQQKIEKKMMRGDNKESRITASSQLSVIIEREEDRKVCFQCEDKDFEIDSLRVQVQQQSQSEQTLRVQNARLKEELQRSKQKCLDYQRSIKKVQDYARSQISAEYEVKSEVLSAKSIKKEGEINRELYGPSFQQYFISEVLNIEVDDIDMPE